MWRNENENPRANNIYFAVERAGAGAGEPGPVCESATGALDRYAWKRSVHAHSERNGIRLRRRSELERQSTGDDVC